MRRLLLLVLLAAGCATVPERGVKVTARPVPLDTRDASRTLLGRLRYLGGVELRSPDPRFGGLSSLRWRGGRLHAVSDRGDWVSFAPVEEEERLAGIGGLAIGDLRGPDGRALDGTDTGDAEALADWDGGWLVGFEHDHKILRYDRLDAPARASGLDPQALFGLLDKNKGVETLAAGSGGLFLCAERLPAAGTANCAIFRDGRRTQVALPPPAGLDPTTAWPVDAAWAPDGGLFILMRSWSGGTDNRAAILARAPDGKLRTLATFVRPITLDNYEGLALRLERGRTFLYLVSDNNFYEYDRPERPEDRQRILLLKFELVG